MGDRIVTKVLRNRIPNSTFIYDNFLNYFFANTKANKIYYNPRKKNNQRVLASITRNFSKFLLVGMDTLDGFYNLRESISKIELATAIANSGGSSWVINFSWNNSSIHENLLTALKNAQMAGVKFVARDSDSSARLSKQGIVADVCPDLAFLINEIQSKPRKRHFHKTKHAEKYAVLAPSFTFGRLSEQIELFVNISLKLRDLGITPILYASVTQFRKGDQIIIKRINAKLRTFNLQPMPIYRDEISLYYILQESVFVFSGRMHVAIVAFTNLVPVFIFEYQGKSKGLLKDLGMPPIFNSKPEIKDKEFKEFVNNNLVLRKNLNEMIPLFRDKVNQLLLKFVSY